jgi:hypothetical protein
LIKIMTAGHVDAASNSTKPASEIKMSGSAQQDFGAELGKLRASNNSGRLDRSLSLLGVLAAIAGLGIILLGFAQSRNYSSILNQMDALILSLFGLGLVIVGAALYLRGSMTRFLRYWLLRMVYEQRDLARDAARIPVRSLDE